MPRVRPKEARGDNPEVSAKSHGVCISGIGKPAAESEVDLRMHAKGCCGGATVN